MIDLPHFGNIDEKFTPMVFNVYEYEVKNILDIFIHSKQKRCY